MSKTEIEKTGQDVAIAAGQGSNIPAYLQGKENQGAVLNGVDASDLILPRIKLLQAISPEVEANEEAKAGIFWHNVLGEPIGPEFDFIVASFRKKYLLMAPMGDARKVMARAEDGIHWDKPDAEFRVKLKGIKEEQIWRTAPTVAESRLDRFGSSVKGDPDSKPAAVMVYEYLVYLPDFPQYSPIIMSLARSQSKKGKDLNSKITFRNQPLQAMRFKARVIEESGEEGPFKNYDFVSNGFATEVEYNRCLQIAEQFGDYKVADEEGAVNEGDSQAPTGVATEQF
jgi:hypothetical protein